MIIFAVMIGIQMLFFAQSVSLYNKASVHLERVSNTAALTNRFMLLLWLHGMSDISRALSRK
jgi:hypothetical protein